MKKSIIFIMITLLIVVTPCFNYDCFAKSYSSDNNKTYTLKVK